MDQELWRDIPGWEGQYQASNMGGIKSLERKIWNPPSYRCSGFWRLIKERTLKPCLTPGGYLSVALSFGGNPAQYSVHVLIAQAWLNLKSNSGLVVNHLNGIKTDNRVSNLEVTTIKGNVEHAIHHGLIKTRFNHVFSRLSLNEALEIANIKKTTGKTNQSLADMYGVSRTTIHRVLRWLQDK